MLLLALTQHPTHNTKQERPDLANLKSALVVSNAKMKAELAALEGRILGLLSASSGNILDDEELINTLAQAKVGALAATSAAVNLVTYVCRPASRVAASLSTEAWFHNTQVV